MSAATPSASSGSPASAARRAPPWCWQAAPPSSPTDATPSRSASRCPPPIGSMSKSRRRASPPGSAGPRLRRARIGYDPWLHTRAFVDEANAALAPRGGILVAVEANPIDMLWTDRPTPSDARLEPYRDTLAGQSSAAKRAMIGDWLAERGADALVLTALDSIAWTLNVRGADVAHTPVALSYAIVDADGSADLFVAPGKVDDATLRHLGNAVRVRDRAEFASALGTYAGKRVAADPERSVAAIVAGARGRRRHDRRRTRSRRPRQGASRTLSRSRATAPPASATAPRSPASSAGSRPKARAARRPNSPPPPSCSNSAKRPGCCATPRSAPSPPPAPTARCRTIMSRRNRTRRSSPASSTSSIRAASMRTAPPTSPA